MTRTSFRSHSIAPGAIALLSIMISAASAADFMVPDKLAVTSNNGAIFYSAPNTGDALPVMAPATGGTRMFWYPKKAAFRAGNVTGTQWDDALIGSMSFAAGSNVVASGGYSVALGYSTVASGNMSTALGYSTSATGYYAPFSSGWSSTASGSVAHAMGYWAVASGSFSTALGTNTLASGDASTALSASTRAEGANSTSMGISSTASSYASVAIGRFNLTGGSATTWVATDPLFVIGNGTGSNPSLQKNAFLVKKNGDAGVQGVLRVWDSGDISMGGFSSGPQPPAK